MKLAAVDGDIENGSVMAGQIAAMVTKEETCKEIIDDVISGARRVLEELGKY